MAATWLRDAVFYEIYPQSFYDTNADGIGDLKGITEKLPYVKSLGCNALWLNPFYDSPFQDAGYDVRDFKKIAPRYGTEADLKERMDTAHSMGIRVLFDLVPGHTSAEHPWFIRSCEFEENDLWHRYIWTDCAFTRGDTMPFIGGQAPRNGTFIVNYFAFQPALNYGYSQINEPAWQQPTNSPEAVKTREAMKDIMRHWLAFGCDGFRVDMADSLVKNDAPEKKGTMEVWKDITSAIHTEFPDAALVSEWNNPRQALNCGFDMDFYLDWGGNGYNSLLRDFQRNTFGEVISKDNSYFKLDSDRDMSRFLEDYLPAYEATKDKGLWCLITGNHDTNRPAPFLTDMERRLAYTFLFTMPGAPFLYYGDEIGMRYRWLPTKEGGYQRTGARTPMQWSSGKNLGFSTAEAEMLYLPIDDAPGYPTVEAQEADPKSLLNHMRAVIALRHSEEDLQCYSPFAVYSAEKGSRLFAYKRGKLLLAVNPGTETCALALDGKYEAIFTVGKPSVEGSTATLPSQSFVILKPCE